MLGSHGGCQKLGVVIVGWSLKGQADVSVMGPPDKK
jgi:hypothetical protein